MLQDVGEILNKKRFDENDFQCTIDRINESFIIKIKKGNTEKQYSSPIPFNGDTFAITWLNDYMKELESGEYD